MAPGSTVTKAPTIVVAMGNTLGSKIFIEHPASGVAGACESLYVKGLVTFPAGLCMFCSLFGVTAINKQD